MQKAEDGLGVWTESSGSAGKHVYSPRQPGRESKRLRSTHTGARKEKFLKYFCYFSRGFVTPPHMRRLWEHVCPQPGASATCPRRRGGARGDVATRMPRSAPANKRHPAPLGQEPASGGHNDKLRARGGHDARTRGVVEAPRRSSRPWRPAVVTSRNPHT